MTIASTAKCSIRTAPFPISPFFRPTPLSNFACVQAYNDALAEWRAVSDRYVPVAIIPYMSEIDVVVGEVERCVKRGHRGVVMLAEPAFTKKV